MPNYERHSTGSSALADSAPLTGGYEVDVQYARKFAKTVDDTATDVDVMKRATPRFDGWQLAPMCGVPVVAQMFIGRLNVIADTWADCAGILAGQLHADSGKVSRAVGNYVAAEQASTVK